MPLGGGAPVRQLASHARLLHDASTAPVPPNRSRRGRPDAIVVPTARPASTLTGIIDLAAELQTLLVVVCSRQANVEQVAERIGRVAGAHGLVVPVDQGYALPTPALETSSPAFHPANAGRMSDLSVKRNLGLLLARLHGWHKIVFIDDDITVSASDIARLTGQLDNHQIAGMVCRRFADNSVFCHARRLARLRQDVFVTGAVLGVNCADLPLPFFPDVYNEDWFFFGEAAAGRRLTKAGEARQAPYNPFGRTDRARHEEFGDLLAEGLYALMESQRRGDSFEQVLQLATERYWSTFVDARREDLADTRSRLEAFTRQASCSDDVHAAIRSLNAADSLYAEGAITSGACAQFLEAWRSDVVAWSKLYSRANNLGSTRDALRWLGIEERQRVR